MIERRVLLLALDGLDWTYAKCLADAGKLPGFARMFQEASSAGLAGIPCASPAAWWTSAATGTWPHQHGIVGRGELDHASARLLRHSSRNRRCPAFWNLLDQAGLRLHMLGWPAARPAERINGWFVTKDWIQPVNPGGHGGQPSAGGIHPADLASALDGCRVGPEELDPGLLGLFFKNGLDLSELVQQRVSNLLFNHLSRLYSCHNSAIAILQDERERAEPWRMIALHYEFPEVIHRFCGRFRRAEADPTSRALYGEVEEGSLRLLDVLLCDLLNTCGQDTTLVVVSARDHQLSDEPERRLGLPGPAADPTGRVFVWGPGIQAGCCPHRASVLDLAPTVLHLLGLSIPESMPGRAWIEVERPPRDAVRYRPDAQPAHAIPTSTEEPVGGPIDPAASFDVQLDFHVQTGMSMLAAGEPARAVEPLARAMSLRPEEPMHGHHLAKALLACGLRQQAMQALDGLADYADDDAIIRLHLAGFALRCGDLKSARRHLAHPDNLDPSSSERSAEFRLLDALLHHHEGRHDLAESVCREALALKPEMAEGWLGLAKVMLGRHRFDESEAAARQSLRLLGNHPHAHWIIARCAERRGDAGGALHHAALALRDAPGMPDARRLMAEHFPDVGSELREQLLLLMRQASSERPAFGCHPSTARKSLAAAWKDEPRAPIQLTSHRSSAVIQTLRPATPDESRRAWSFLGIQDAPVEADCPPFVALTGTPARIVAAAAVKADNQAEWGRVHIRILPAHRHPSLLGALVRGAQTGRTGNGMQLMLILRRSDPLVDMAKETGFRIIRTDSWWLGDMESSHKRLCQAKELSCRIKFAGPHPTVSQLQPEDLAAIGKIVRAHHLLTLRDAMGDLISAEMGDVPFVEDASREPVEIPGNLRQTVYDPLLSTVVRIGNQIAAVQLVQWLAGDTVLVHARAVDPEFMSLSGKLNILLYTRFLDPVFADVRRFLFSGEVGIADETIAMAGRFGATHLGDFVTLSKT